ncbi:ArsR/SmtB family transcription factor [Varunaivibrio sulfuroxidans]|uniref:ArsR family transcriptional regulator n=1 Tax=Varunaivibrio sulfuroxidans TaxID=1773489 RepID=A0A4V2UP84_9PROT|nr:metalloregulator ArsR/SmtB family transcription factor [Varunaivibrio sulfuroxidans]TCS64941.1 ArsR family transcriptional regulator [Varunaivibrio sulfuroxidans]WES29767.1 metalloregulator ArsR/SmtB family transcription factor [Varunaivibrio sulfuroxidans]
MNTLLMVLRAAADETRLRLLNLFARGEWTVSEVVRVLGQSQPRVSRHLKILTDSGLLERYREGSWVFHRLTMRGSGRRAATALLDLLSEDDPVVTRDLEQLDLIIAQRRRDAAEYFGRAAASWDEVRSLHLDEILVERAIMDTLTPSGIDDFLDIGTGTGRMVELYAPRVTHALGVDQSHEMLSLARANLERAGLTNAHVRQADAYQLPFESASFDGVCIHQVLHFLDHPSRAVTEAGRVLRAGGRLLVVDFAPHQYEHLRENHAHRRLGFSDDEVTAWVDAGGLKMDKTLKLTGGALTVGLWLAVKPQRRADVDNRAASAPS